MNLLQLEYFVCVAQSNTLIEAAEILNVSQSTLSIAIKKLEQEFCVELFTHRGRKLELTEMGFQFLENALTVLSDVEVLKQSMSRRQVQQENVVTLSLDAVDFGMESTTLYTAIHPEVHFRRIRESSKALHTRLLSRQTDFCITMLPYNHKDVENTLLIDEPVVLMVNRQNPLATCESVSMNDLVNQIMITLSVGSGTRTNFDEYFEVAGVTPKEIVEVREPETMAMLVQKNFGAIFIPRSIYHMQQHRELSILDSVVALPIKEDYCRRQVYLLRLRKRKLPMVCQAFSDYIKSYSALANELGRIPDYDDFLPPENDAAEYTPPM